MVPEVVCRALMAHSGQSVARNYDWEDAQSFLSASHSSPLCFSFSVSYHSPGAGRAWPLPGFWFAQNSSFTLHMSYRRECTPAHSFSFALCLLFAQFLCRSWSEYQAPTKCVVEEACPGYTNGPSNGVTNFIDTQTCAVGYESTRCASCSAGYYQLNSRCYFCGSSVDQSSTIAITVVVGFGIMTILALAVSTLPSLKLAQAIQIFSLFQGAATVGVAGAQDSPYFGKELHVAMTYFNFSQCPAHVTPAAHPSTSHMHTHTVFSVRS